MSDSDRSSDNDTESDNDRNSFAKSVDFEKYIFFTFDVGEILFYGFCRACMGLFLGSIPYNTVWVQI